MDTCFVEIPQNQETHIATISTPAYRVRYAFARSAESRAADEKGQDSLCFQYNDEQVIFALCDGVSMSFMGDIAAAFLSKELVRWLSGLNVIELDELSFQQQLIEHLAQLVEPGSEIVNEYQLPDGLPAMFLSVLDEKRSLGSESMFICGVLNTQLNRLTLGWLGDSRLRLWLETKKQYQQEFQKALNTHDRWSTKRGCLGRPTTFISDFDQIDRVVAYSDGFALLDGKMDSPYSNEALHKLLEVVGKMPNSDDCSFFEFTRLRQD